MSADESTKVKVGDWDAIKDRDGSVYYENRVTKERTHSMPQGGPWVQRLSPDGKLFWKNTVTGEKTWRQPVLDSGEAQNIMSSPPPSIVSHRSVLPEESPSKVVVDALQPAGVEGGKGRDAYQVQLELLSAERNIEVELRKRQETHNTKLQRIIQEQQDRLARLEDNAATRRTAPEPHTPPSGQWREWETPTGLPYWAQPGSEQISLRRPPPQDKMTPERAFTLAKEICNTVDPSTLHHLSDPRAAAETLLTQYIKDTHSKGYPRSPPAYPQHLQNIPRTVRAQDIDLAPILSQASRMVQGADNDRQMVLNLNLQDDGTGRYTVAQQEGGQGQDSQVVNVALDVFHDGQGRMTAVQPMSGGQGGTSRNQQSDAVVTMGDACKVNVEAAQPFVHPKGMGKAKVREELEEQRELLTTQQAKLDELQEQIGEVLKNQQSQMGQAPALEASGYSAGTQDFTSPLGRQPSALPRWGPHGSQSYGSMQTASPQQQQQHQRPVLHDEQPQADKPMCPISEFREYEMADTMNKLQTLARTRPGQGRPPHSVPLPADAQVLQPFEPVDQQPSMSLGPQHSTGMKRRSIPL